MARLFSTGDSITTTMPSTTTLDPVSIAAWFNLAALGNNEFVFYNGDSGSNGYGILASYSGNANHITGIKGGIEFLNTAVSMTTGVWAHIALTYSTNNWDIYHNASATHFGNAEPYTPTGNFHIGGFNGDAVAECAFWTVKLTQAEVTALANGASPLLVRPAALLSYWPLLGRASPEIDVVGGLGGTLSGTSATPHPRIIRPRRQRFYYYSSSLRQIHYRFRIDAGAVDATPTWGAAEDTNGFDPGTSNFRLRVSIANSVAGSVSAQPFELYLSKNFGAYAPITTSSTGGVKSANAGSDADNTVIKVPRLTPGA